MGKYYLIGEHLSHSFSPQVHAMLGNPDYSLKEIAPQALEHFIREGDYDGLNVTIPYKTTVIPYLSHISERAEEIGAVNTVVNRGGELWGYNTDFYGISELISHAGIVLENKKVVILGTGGTAKTASAVSSS